MQQDVAPTGQTSDGSSTVAVEPEFTERRAVTPAEFSVFLAHFYRGEISRANTWRTRLDGTFNWAVLTTGTTLSFAFGDVNSPHVVLLINSLLIAVFLFIEARRYRYYEVWSSRVRVIETDYIAPLLSSNVRSVTHRDAWSEHLAEDLLRPHFTVGLWEAVGRRLRRNYIWIFVLVLVSWVIKIAIHPVPAAHFNEFVSRASIGALSGRIVMAIVAIYVGLLFAIAFLTASFREDSTEVSTHGFERSLAPSPKRESRLWGRQEDLDKTGTFQPMQHKSKGRPTATLRPKDD
ncbi:MAG TPA: DUF2270 domain-containing protein [Blastocatellia bacterium]|nr:DUF2270 domain-containing protein [Blastocatellia bacterium]